MHLLRQASISLDEAAAAVDLEQTPADVVFLSFSDSDLALAAAAWKAGADRLPSLRLASLSRLKHPFSVDLYVEKVVAQARFILVRLLGGLDYWRYGIDELAAAARSRGAELAVVPGDHKFDERLDEASTLPGPELRRIWAYFQEGGIENAAQCLNFIAARLGWAAAFSDPRPLPPFALYDPCCRKGRAGAPRALVLFYRSILLAADTAPILALADALSQADFAVAAASVTSLKDPAVSAGLAEHLAIFRPDVIINATAFSARIEGAGGVLEKAAAPVLQVTLAGSTRDQWEASPRGLSAADLAMNIVLPELDGRIITRAVSFKAEEEYDPALEFARLTHRPEPSRVAFVASLAAGWAKLRQRPRAERRLVLILSDYPAKSGRTGYAVGLDTPASVVAILERLRMEGYTVGRSPVSADLMRVLSEGSGEPLLSVAEYVRLLAGLPADFAAAVHAAWGAPEDDPGAAGGFFRMRLFRSGNVVVAVQPDRGHCASRRADYHSADLPPRHAYVAFYLWLRELERVDAVIHCGTHGTLEWLPGKAVALSGACSPEAVLGPLPVIYPFIVNNPGEAAQAKRRIAAVTIGHLTPPLAIAGSHGAAAELEALFDEYAQAEATDPRRARMLGGLILERARDSGLLEESGANGEDDPRSALVRLDAWLCDLKERRIGDGLHVFGRTLDAPRRAAMLASVQSCSVSAVSEPEGPRPARADQLLDACAEGEMRGLLDALDGHFVEPGPAGAPSRGRLDVLPTGRNLFTIDPRAVPTRTAWEIGRRTADEVLARYAQDHGDWPRRIVIDLWGSATMRTGGDDLAQAMALLGVRPIWDNATTRVSGFEILALASLGRPRVDVTARVSGLFRDVFPAQIALLDRAVRAVAALDEPATENPLAGLDGMAAARIFGGPPGSYGLGLSRRIAAGAWSNRDELGEAYLEATSHAYGTGEDGIEAGPEFRARVAAADAYVHVQDMAEQDVLDSDAFAEHEGGFGAAAGSLGNRAALYHADATRPGRTNVRSLAQEVARVLRGRATNPRWLEGQMRHGHRGAAEIAETIDNLFAFAALSDAVPHRHFDLMFDATCGDERVRSFLIEANPQAAGAIAARFEEALARGMWIARRNSVAATLAEMREADA